VGSNPTPSAVVVAATTPWLPDVVRGWPYDACMPDEVYRAADVAAELRRRLPGIGAKKLHKLLYYC
jgi:hypothetical protein